MAEAKEAVILTQQEIQQKIEALGESGSSVFFYLGAGPSEGGPFGRGAAVVELNPVYPGHHQKKYNIYTTAVEGLEPKGMGQVLFRSDKPKDIAKWVKERHYMPTTR